MKPGFNVVSAMIKEDSFFRIKFMQKRKSDEVLSATLRFIIEDWLNSHSEDFATFNAEEMRAEILKSHAQKPTKVEELVVAPGDSFASTIANAKTKAE